MILLIVCANDCIPQIQDQLGLQSFNFVTANWHKQSHAIISVCTTCGTKFFYNMKLMCDTAPHQCCTIIVAQFHSVSFCLFLSRSLHNPPQALTVSDLVPIKGFVHEILCWLRTFGSVIQTALCYLEGPNFKHTVNWNLTGWISKVCWWNSNLYSTYILPIFHSLCVISLEFPCQISPCCSLSVPRRTRSIEKDCARQLQGRRVEGAVIGFCHGRLHPYGCCCGHWFSWARSYGTQRLWTAMMCLVIHISTFNIAPGFYLKRPEIPLDAKSCQET
jgi:hypothetical protein